MGTYIGGMMAVIGATGAAYFVLGERSAEIISLFGSIAATLGMLAYIVIWDSRKRWPGVKAFDRFARIVTFYRG